VIKVFVIAKKVFSIAIKVSFIVLKVSSISKKVCFIVIKVYAITKKVLKPCRTVDFFTATLTLLYHLLNLLQQTTHFYKGMVTK